VLDGLCVLALHDLCVIVFDDLCVLTSYDGLCVLVLDDLCSSIKRSLVYRRLNVLYIYIYSDRMSLCNFEIYFYNTLRIHHSFSSFVSSFLFLFFFSHGVLSEKMK